MSIYNLDQAVCVTVKWFTRSDYHVEPEKTINFLFFKKVIKEHIVYTYFDWREINQWPVKEWENNELNYKYKIDSYWYIWIKPRVKVTFSDWSNVIWYYDSEDEANQRAVSIDAILKNKIYGKD